MKLNFRTCFLLLGLFLSVCSTSFGFEDYCAETFAHLDSVVEEKKAQLMSFCTRLYNKASSIKYDNVMLSFFKAKNQYYKATKYVSVPDDIRQEIEKLKSRIQSYYVSEYFAFYDLLFVNIEGDIFYTMRKDEDYHSNLFQGEMAKTHLSKMIAKNAVESFADFQYFYASREPAAFFVEPIIEDGNQLGWIILQCSINKINSLFLGYEGLGATGEVFLVNKDQFMLTESRFIGDSTVLRKHLSPENIAEKFKEKKGRKIVTDYRGFQVLSSFEVFSSFGVEWLIVAKIDEDEVLTEYFKDNQDSLLGKLVANVHVGDTVEVDDNHPSFKGAKLVDMDEYVRVAAPVNLMTYGVSTCTCFVAAYPEHVAYMAHLSPYDRVYGVFADSVYTNLTGEIMKHITRFDVYPYEKRYLKFYAVANHTDSIAGIIQTLLDNGIFLSQLYFLHEPTACKAKVAYDYVRDDIFCEWQMSEEIGKERLQTSEKLQTLGTVLKGLLD